MNAVRFHRHGGAEVLELEETDRPEPSPGEVLVRVRSAGVNPVDVKYREQKADTLPRTAGSDFAGIVERVGDDVDSLSAGDRVFGTGLHNNALKAGSYAEYVAVPIEVVAHLPEDVGFEEGAAVALVGVTAWRALVDRANIEPGETCLVHGGSGGVGHVALQLAAHAGAHTVTTAAPEYHGQLEAIGADDVLDYDRSDLRAALEQTAPTGVDVTVDHHLDEYAQFDVDVAAFGGRVVCIDGATAELDDAGVGRGKEIDFHFVGMDNLLRPELPAMSTVLRKVAKLVDSGAIEVEVARTYPLEDAPRAHTELLEDSFLGKIVLVPE